SSTKVTTWTPTARGPGRATGADAAVVEVTAGVATVEVAEVGAGAGAAGAGAGEVRGGPRPPAVTSPPAQPASATVVRVANSPTVLRRWRLIRPGTARSCRDRGLRSAQR